MEAINPDIQAPLLHQRTEIVVKDTHDPFVGNRQGL